MKVIILCGGVGTRLKEETEYKPKPMVFVGGKPILWHIMKIYAANGFHEFILALGYKADYIKDYFLNQKAFTSDFTVNTKTHDTTFYLDQRKEVDDFTITFVDTGLRTLPGERILRCREYIDKQDECFMVTYGDGVANINVKKLLRYHKKTNKIVTLTGVHPRSKFGRVNIIRNNIVTGFIEKPVLTDWVNGGFMVCNMEFFHYLRDGESEHPALNRLIKKRQVSLYKHNDFWFSVDTFKELDDLNAIWNTGKPPWKIWQ